MTDEDAVAMPSDVPMIDPDANTGRLGTIALPRFATGTVELDKLELAEPKVLRIEDVAQLVHDFKGPLATIALEVWILDEKVGPGNDFEVRRTVARINHNLLFLDRMVQDLLDSCASDRGHFVLQRRPTELRALLERVVERVVAGRDVSRVVLESGDRVILSIDDLRIERVVANLISNALKYTARATKVVIRLERAPRHVRISVTDTGPGMTKHEMSYVFDEYRRTPSAHAIEGTGLGLYASKRIVEAHGGQIRVESTCGVGSRFYVDLPFP